MVRLFHVPTGFLSKGEIFIAGSEISKGIDSLSYQPIYFCGDSLRDVKDKISDYCDGMNRAFHPVYDPVTQSVETSRAVRRLPQTHTSDLQAARQKAYFDQLNSAKEAYNLTSTNTS